MAKIDKSFLTKFRADLEVALKQVSDKHGLAFQQGNIRFTETMFSMSKVEFTLKEAAIAAAGTDDIDPTYFNAMKRYSPFVGVPITSVNTTIKLRGVSYKLLGMGKTGKFFVGRNAKNALVKLPIEEVRTAVTEATAESK